MTITERPGMLGRAFWTAGCASPGLLASPAVLTVPAGRSTTPRRDGDTRSGRGRDRDALAKLEPLGDDAIASPGRRPCDFLVLETLVVAAHSLFEKRPIRDRPALRRGPCAQTMSARATRKVRIGFRRIENDNRPLDPYLPFESGPVEQERRPTRPFEIARFGALVVGEKDEAAFVVAAQQDHPDGGRPLGRGRRQRHRVGLEDPRRDGRLEPDPELGDRIAQDLALVEPPELVATAHPQRVIHGNFPAANPVKNAASIASAPPTASGREASTRRRSQTVPSAIRRKTLRRLCASETRTKRPPPMAAIARSASSSIEASSFVPGINSPLAFVPIPTA